MPKYPPTKVIIEYDSKHLRATRTNPAGDTSGQHKHEGKIPMTIQQQLEVIANKFQAASSVTVEQGEQLLSLLDKAPQEALQMLVDRKVKFCWIPAMRRLRNKFGVTI